MNPIASSTSAGDPTIAAVTRAIMTSAGQGSSMRNIVAISWLFAGRAPAWGEFSVGGHRARGICRKFCPSRRRSALWLVTAVKIAVRLLARRYVDNQLSELVGSLARAFGERPLGFRLYV